MARKTGLPQSYKSAETVSDSESSGDASSSSSESASEAKRQIPSKMAETPSKKVKFSDKNEIKSITASEATSEASEDEGTSGSDSDSEEGVSSGSDSEESEENEADSGKINNHDNDTSPVRTPSNPDPPTSPKRLSYAPPVGFSKVKSIPKLPSLASTLSPTSLHGKQLWHIVAPASVPLTELRSFTADQIKSGAAVVSYNGSQYRLSHKHPDQDTRVLVPEENGIYKQVTMEITQYLSLTHTLSLPDSALFPDDREPSDADVVNVHDVRPARQQPEGLRTRWWPTGFEDKEAQTSHGAVAKNKKEPSKKPKHVNDESTPSKKHKKDKVKSEKSEKKKRKKPGHADVEMED